MAELPLPESQPSPEFLERFRIAAQGAEALRFDRFMHVALYDTAVGYYRSEKRRVGRTFSSDFYTATSSGPLFGELVVAACEKLLLGQDLHAFTFVEVGAEPGGGIMGSGVRHRFREVITLRVGEPLRIPTKAIVFSNELFDAQPFRRFVSTGAGWEEIWVQAHQGRLQEVRRGGLNADLPRAIAEASAPAGYQLDVSFAAVNLLRQIVDQSWTGLFVAFDYGTTWRALLEERPAGTGRAYYQHKQYADLLERPGRQDLTCHVCWDWLADAMRASGFETPTVDSQEAFFMHHAGEAIEKTIGAEAGAFSPRKMGLMQLLHPGNMGQKFQVLSGTRNK